MIASLERSSSSKNYNGDHDDEGGGRRSSSLNKSQRNSTSYSLTKDQRPSVSYSHSPSQTQRTLLSRGIVYDLLSFCAPRSGVSRGPTREESDTWTEGEETIKSAHQARLLTYPPLLTPVHTGSGSRSPFVPTDSPFVCAIIPINRQGFAIRFYAFWVAICFHRHGPSV